MKDLGKIVYLYYRTSNWYITKYKTEFMGYLLDKDLKLFSKYSNPIGTIIMDPPHPSYYNSHNIELVKHPKYNPSNTYKIYALILHVEHL